MAAIVDVAKFRLDFPEFVNPTTYPDPSIQFYLDLAQGDPATGLEGFIGPRWGSKAPFGAELFTAHNLCLETLARKAAAAGRNPGEIIAPLTGGTVDKVSYARTLQDILLPGQGHWNLSTYGLRYIQLVRMIGAGPVQVGPASCGPGLYPWPGPQFPPNY